MVNFVCIVFEQGVKMLTLSSMENLIVECNLVALLSLSSCSLMMVVWIFLTVPWVVWYNLIILTIFDKDNHTTTLVACVYVLVYMWVTF